MAGLLDLLAQGSQKFNEYLGQEGESEPDISGPARLVRRLGRGLPREEQRVPAANALEYQQFLEQYGREPRQGEMQPELIPPMTQLAGQVSGANMASNTGGVSVPGYRYGSTAKYRMPMYLRNLEHDVEAGAFLPEGSTSGLYKFRNRLDDPNKFRGSASMFLNPEKKEAHIGFLRMKKAGDPGPRGKAIPRASVHGQEFGTEYSQRSAGVTPEQIKETVGRLVEDLVGAGFTKFSSDPISLGRGRLFNRIAQKLKAEGKIPQEVEYTQDVASMGRASREEGPAMRRLLDRRILERGGITPEDAMRQSMDVDTYQALQRQNPDYYGLAPDASPDELRTVLEQMGGEMSPVGQQSMGTPFGHSPRRNTLADTFASDPEGALTRAIEGGMSPGETYRLGERLGLDRTRVGRIRGELYDQGRIEGTVRYQLRQQREASHASNLEQDRALMQRLRNEGVVESPLTPEDYFNRLAREADEIPSGPETRLQQQIAASEADFSRRLSEIPAPSVDLNDPTFLRNRNLLRGGQ